MLINILGLYISTSTIALSISQVTKWSLRVWLTSVLVTPFLYILLYPILKPTAEPLKGNFDFIVLIIPLTLFFTLPCWFVLWRSAYRISARLALVWSQKLALTAIGIVFSFLPFQVYFAKGTQGRSLVLMPALYSLTIVTGIWLYKLKPVMHNISDTNS